MLAPGQRCTHECPQFDTMLDRNRFHEDDQQHGVKRGEHDDPREQTEDTHWGLGFLTSLTEVVEEDVTIEEESSPEVSSSDVSYNFPSPQTKVRDPLPRSTNTGEHLRSLYLLTTKVKIII